MFGAISAKFPEPEAAFVEAAKRKENSTLGDYQLVKVANSAAGA